jgi:hypothetical protein
MVSGHFILSSFWVKYFQELEFSSYSTIPFPSKDVKNNFPFAPKAKPSEEKFLCVNSYIF